LLRGASLKFPIRIAVLAVLALVAVLSPLATVPGLALADTPPTRTITVTGTGSSYAPPDIAYISVGVEIVNENPATAVKEADAKMSAIVKTVKDAGVRDTDIQTEQYNIFRDNAYDNKTNTQKPVYRLINTVRVTVREIAKVGDILGTAVETGANVVNNVSFGIKDTKASESTARKAALDDAKSRATELAATIGATLGQVIAIGENGSYYPPVASFATGKGGGGGGGGITGGALEVSISVTVTYEIK
jgi:uncharacterized protein YggE